MNSAFRNCTSLVVVLVIPDSIIGMEYTFVNCSSLTGEIEFNANPNEYYGVFAGTVKPITLTGSSTMLNAIAGTANKGNITVAQ